MKSTFVKPKFRDNTNSRVGLVALSTDFSIEKDFNSIFLNLPIDLFVNRLPFYNPLTDFDKNDRKINRGDRKYST